MLAIREIRKRFHNHLRIQCSGIRGNGTAAPVFNNDFEELNEPTKLYESHIRTTRFQKLVLTAASSITSIMDPRRHDMIAVFGETTGHRALINIYSIMMKDKEGFDIITEKPRISTSTVDLDFLSNLKETTLGHHYFKFLNDNNVTPDSRMPVRFVNDIELAYVMQRYREVHDLIHTVLGMPTNMQGEVAVKWVEAFQTGLPMCYSAAIFGPLRFKKKQRKNYLSSYLQWAITVGNKAKPLMNVYYEKRWEQDMADLRKELNIDPYE